MEVRKARGGMCTGQHVVHAGLLTNAVEPYRSSRARTAEGSSLRP